jgi:ADP-ribosyl-[dinitrogen reductase] hydrolase
MFEYNNKDDHDPREHKLIKYIVKETKGYIQMHRPKPILVDWSETCATESDKTVEQILNGATDKELRAIGCMCGMMIGDAFGAPMEFSHLIYDNPNPVTTMTSVEHFNLKAGQFTDDTSMGLCLADSLIYCKEFNPTDFMLRNVGWWYLGYNNAFKYDKQNSHRRSVGLGGNISESLYEFIKYGHPYTKAGDLNTSGNGSIMRNAPIPVMFCQNMDNALKFAYLQSKTTHQGTISAECAKLLTYICVNWINDNTVPLIDLVNSFSVDSNDETILKLKNSNEPFNWKNKNFRFHEERSKKMPGYIGSFSADCLALALHCILYTINFKEAIIKCCNYGGDADSTGSVTGQMAGAKYGYNNIPSEWLEECHKWHNGEIIIRAEKLFHLNNKNKTMD